MYMYVIDNKLYSILRGTCEKEYSTKTIKVEFNTNVLRLRRELGIYSSRGGGGVNIV